MDGINIIIREENVISLRTAFVGDDGDIVDLRLTPFWTTSSLPEAKPKGFDYISQDCAWLYRHTRSSSEEEKLISLYPPIVQSNLKPLLFSAPPEFKLVWTDSGHSVALFLNGEPWAFIDEQTHEGYSKGVLPPKKKHLPPIGKQWNQDLFEKIFNKYI